MRIAAIALSLFTVQNPADVDVQTPRHVIWIAVDSLRADHLHFAGYDRDTSPWLDALVPSSAVFTAAYSPANTTGFSVAATMAGRHYSLLDHDSHPPHIPPDVETLPHVLQEGAVRTFGWIANAVLVAHGDKGLARGFDEWHKIIPNSAPKASIDEIIDYIKVNYESTAGHEFHYIHTMDVHKPYVPPMPFDRLWPEHEITTAVLYGSLPHADQRDVLSNLPYHSEGHQIREPDIAFLKTQYDGAIRFTDARLPALLDALDYDPEKDLLIISADHGEQLFEHNFWGHGKSLYPEEINVPLIIRGPGITPGRHEGPVSLIDLFPTLCDLLRLAPPDGLMGTSLMSTLKDGSPVTSHTVYSEMPSWTGGVFAPGAVVIHGTELYKIDTNVHWRRPWQIWPYSEELFRLDVDPNCYTNLAETSRQRADELNSILREINPRYAPYTPQAIRGKDADVTLGPELMPKLTGENNKRVYMETASIHASAKGGVSMYAPGTQFHTYVLTDPGRPHLLEVRYTLTQGVFRLSMHDENSGKSFWEYTLRKTGQETKTLRAMITPTWNLSRLTIKALTPGNARFLSISLRAAALPKLEVIQWRRTSTQEGAETQAVQKDVKNALEALGYLD